MRSSRFMTALCGCPVKGRVTARFDRITLVTAPIAFVATGQSVAGSAIENATTGVCRGHLALVITITMCPGSTVFTRFEAHSEREKPLTKGFLHSEARQN